MDMSFQYDSCISDHHSLFSILRKMKTNRNQRDRARKLLGSVCATTWKPLVEFLPERMNMRQCQCEP